MNGKFGMGMELLTAVAVASCFNNFFKSVIGPKLEKTLGRKPTDWDWQLYWKELGKKAEFEAVRKIYQEWQAEAHARRVIHDFVWNNDF